MGSKKQAADESQRRAAAEYVAVDELMPWVKNPRKNDKAVASVAESIRRFGFGNPLLARKENGEVIAGHTRLKAAISLGMTEIPVRYMDLSESEAHLLALADNKLGEKADWDDAKIDEILSQYSDEDALLAGFEAGDSEATGAEEIDVSTIEPEFWLSVRGPLPVQPDVLEKLKAALSDLPGVNVEHGIIA